MEWIEKMGQELVKQKFKVGQTCKLLNYIEESQYAMVKIVKIRPAGIARNNMTILVLDAHNGPWGQNREFTTGGFDLLIMEDPVDILKDMAK